MTKREIRLLRSQKRVKAVRLFVDSIKPTTPIVTDYVTRFTKKVATS